MSTFLLSHEKNPLMGAYAEVRWYFILSTLYMIIDTTTKEMYAWTENKEIAKLFITMRKPGRFIIKKKKIKANDEYAQGLCIRLHS